MSNFFADVGASIGGGAAFGAMFAFCVVELFRALDYEADRQLFLYWGGGLGGVVGAVSALYTG